MLQMFFYLTGLFFQQSLQVRTGPQKSPIKKIWLLPLYFFMSWIPFVSINKAYLSAEVMIEYKTIKYHEKTQESSGMQSNSPQQITQKTLKENQAVQNRAGFCQLLWHGEETNRTFIDPRSLNRDHMSVWQPKMTTKRDKHRISLTLNTCVSQAELQYQA